MRLAELMRRSLTAGGRLARDRDVNAEDAPVKVLCDGDVWDVADVVYDPATGCIIVQVL